MVSAVLEQVDYEVDKKGQKDDSDGDIPEIHKLCHENGFLNSCLFRFRIQKYNREAGMDYRFSRVFPIVTIGKCDKGVVFDKYYNICGGFEVKYVTLWWSYQPFAGVAC